jgi:hypothetical protein
VSAIFAPCGTTQAVDVLHARCGEQERWFLELFTLGEGPVALEMYHAALRVTAGAPS